MSCNQKLSRITAGFKASSTYRKAMFVFIGLVMLYALGVSTYQVLFLKQWLWFSLIAVYAIVWLLAYMLVDELDGGEVVSKSEVDTEDALVPATPVISISDLNDLKAFVKYTTGRSGGLIAHVVDKLVSNPTGNTAVAKAYRLVMSERLEVEDALTVAFESTGLGEVASREAAGEVVLGMIERNLNIKN